ncbi:MAG: amino acid permease [Microcoleus sp. C1-bin4]|nr:amino acid permease [Microcoleus sp. C1-bin4]
MDANQTVTETHPGQRNQLLRVLGLGFGVAVVVGGTIGVSIFRLPGSVAALLGSAWLVILVWTLGGIYTLLSANYTAELATMLPKAGGPYVYARRAFGDYAGFVVGWSGWLGDTAALAFMPIAFGEFTTALFAPNFSGSITIFAISILLLLAALNWLGVRAGSGTQKLVSLLKAVALLGFVVVCFVAGGRGNESNVGHEISSAPVAVSSLFAAFILSFQLILGAYGGWNSAVYFAEEDVNPSRNIPRSLHGGVLLVTIIYLLVNFALLYVLSRAQMAASKLPAADAMSVIFGSSGGQIVTALAILSTVGVINAAIMFVPRTLYGLGRDGLFTARAVAVNQGGTPVVALAVATAVAIFLIAIGNFETLLAIYAFYSVANNILLISSLFVLRRREPDLPRPFRTFGYPVMPFVLLLVSIAFFIGYIISDTTNSLYALVVLAASYPTYRLIKR